MKRKKILVMLGVTVLVSIGILFTSKRITEVELKTSTLNNNNNELFAVRIKNNTGTYEKIKEIPASGYILNEEETFCGIKQSDNTYTKENVNITYENGKVTIEKVNKYGMRCFLYFDKAPKASEVILSDNTVDSSRLGGTFTSTFEENTSGRIFKGPADDYGDVTYFYAGANPNNWVSFAGKWWRIIRINGDGSIRLIYAGSDTTKLPSTIGETTQLLDTNVFNSSRNNNMYVGYMYTSGKVHGIGTSSTIKEILDDWYNGNIENSVDYLKNVETNVGFCGDRQPSTSSNVLNGSGGTGTISTYYAPYIRLNNSHNFTLKCVENNDMYTVSSATKGNKSLSKPIGLITVDEAAFAGGYYPTDNKSYWLYTGLDYWTMSPSTLGGTYAGVFLVRSNGLLSGSVVNDIRGVRPVINLRADTVLTGSGTTTDPYIVS